MHEDAGVSSERKPDAGVSTADGSADAAAEPSMCAKPVSACSARSGSWGIVLDAKAFGDGAQLLASDDQAVIVARGDGVTGVARLQSDVGWDQSFVPLELGDQLPIAIDDETSLNPASGNHVSVLACVPSGACSVWGNDSRQGSDWRELSLPDGLSPVGLIADPMQNVLCVYGDGMICGNADLKRAIPAGVSIRAVTFGSQWSLAVGDHGRWFKSERDATGGIGPWREQPALADVSLTQVSVAGAGGVIVGEGKLRAAVGTQAALFGCDPFGGDLKALMLSEGFAGVAYAITDSGEVYQHAPASAQPADSYCLYQQLSQAVVGVSDAPCGGDQNTRALTKRALFGTNACREVP
jgi:hypothetical protein